MGRFFRIFLEGFLTCFQKGLNGFPLSVCYLIHSIEKFQVKLMQSSVSEKINYFW